MEIRSIVNNSDDKLLYDIKSYDKYKFINDFFSKHLDLPTVINDLYDYINIIKLEWDILTKERLSEEEHKKY